MMLSESLGADLLRPRPLAPFFLEPLGLRPRRWFALRHHTSYYHSASLTAPMTLRTFTCKLSAAAGSARATAIACAARGPCPDGSVPAIGRAGSGRGRAGQRVEARPWRRDEGGRRE